MRISVNWLAAVQQRGAQVLCRLAAGCFTQRSRTLSDGSYLVTLRPKGQIPLILRVIEYRLHPLVAHDLALLPVSRTCRRAHPTAFAQQVARVALSGALSAIAGALRRAGLDAPIGSASRPGS